MISHNIDRTDEAAGTRFPFTESSSLTVRETALPQAAFCGASIQLPPGMTAPARISRLRLRPSRGVEIEASVSDGNGRRLGTALVMEVPGVAVASAVLMSDEGLVRGLLSFYSHEAPAALRDLLQKSGEPDGAGGRKLDLENGSLVFRPELHSAARAEQGMLIEAGGAVVSGACALRCGPGLHTEDTGTDIAVADGRISRIIRYGLSGPFIPVTDSPGIRYLTVEAPLLSVNGTRSPTGSTGRMFVAGSHLIVRSSVESNLRVVGPDAGTRNISLRGVLDE